jgi:hypothetical protein
MVGGKNTEERIIEQAIRTYKCDTCGAKPQKCCHMLHDKEAMFFSHQSRYDQWVAGGKIIPGL